MVSKVDEYLLKLNALYACESQPQGLSQEGEQTRLDELTKLWFSMTSVEKGEVDNRLRPFLLKEA